MYMPVETQLYRRPPINEKTHSGELKPIIATADLSFTLSLCNDFAKLRASCK